MNELVDGEDWRRLVILLRAFVVEKRRLLLDSIWRHEFSSGT
jgi:hypothetical protein